MAKAPFVAVRTDIRKEERVLVIADIAGYSRHEALGRLIDMWAWCTDRKLEDAPDDCEGYAVSDAVVCRFLGSHGVEAILGGHCDELSLGERRDDGLIYLRGTSDTVERLRAWKKSAPAGGRARAASGNRSAGAFASNDTKQWCDNSPQIPDNALPGYVSGLTNAPAGHQPVTSRSPAGTSEIPQATSHKPEDPERGAFAPQPRPAKPKKRRSRIPGDWKPADRERQQAIAAGIDCSALAARFRRHYLASGQPNLNWDEKFAGWIEGELERRARPGPGPGHRNVSQSVLTTLLTDIERMEQEELEKARSHD